jgi:hypothetical protein
LLQQQGGVPTGQQAVGNEGQSGFQMPPSAAEQQQQKLSFARGNPNSATNSVDQTIRNAGADNVSEWRALDYMLLTGDIPLLPGDSLVQAGTDALTMAECASGVSDCVVQ